MFSRHRNSDEKQQHYLRSARNEDLQLILSEIFCSSVIQGVISAKSVWEQSVGGKKSLWQNMAKIAVKSAIYGQICFK